VRRIEGARLRMKEHAQCFDQPFLPVAAAMTARRSDVHLVSLDEAGVHLKRPEVLPAAEARGADKDSRPPAAISVDVRLDETKFLRRLLFAPDCPKNSLAQT